MNKTLLYEERKFADNPENNFAPLYFKYDANGNLISWSFNLSRDDYFAPVGTVFDDNGNLQIKNN